MIAVRVSNGLRAITVLGLFGLVGLLTVAAVDGPSANQSLWNLLLALAVGLFSAVWCLPGSSLGPVRGFDWFNPMVIYIGTFLTYIILPAVWLAAAHDGELRWIKLAVPGGSAQAYTLFFTAMATAAFGLGFRLPLADGGVKTAYRPGLTAMQRLAGIALLVSIGLGARLYHLALYDQDFSDLLMLLSPSARRRTGVEVSQGLIILESMLLWGGLFAVLNAFLCPSGKRSGLARVAAAATLLLAAGSGYLLTGKRSEVLPLLLFPVIWFHYLRERLSTGRAAMLLTLGIVAIGVLLLGRIVLPMLLRGVNVEAAIGGSVGAVTAYYLDTAEWSTFEMVVASMFAREELLQIVGDPSGGFLKFSLSALVIFVPRAFWPDKPGYEDVSFAYFRFVTGSDQPVGLAATLWGVPYLQFGLWGLVGGMLILGVIVRVAYVVLAPWRGTPGRALLYAIFVWQMFAFLRFGTFGFTFLQFVTSMLVGVLGIPLVVSDSRATQRATEAADCVQTAAGRERA